MKRGTEPGWIEANQAYLVAAMDAVRAEFERHLPAGEGTDSAEDSAAAARGRVLALAAEMPAPAALDRLCGAFGLSPFERDLLVLCAADELDSRFAGLCAAVQGDGGRPYPTFGLALAALPHPHWTALTPISSMRRWRLISVDDGPSLVTSRIRIDERVLHFLCGVQYLDERLNGLIQPVAAQVELVPPRQEMARRLASQLLACAAGGRPSVVQLVGDDPEEAVFLAAAACEAAGFQLGRVQAQALPAAPAEAEALARLWEREAILSNLVALIEFDGGGAADYPVAQSAAGFIDRLHCLVLTANPDRARAWHHQTQAFEIPALSVTDRRALWSRLLGQSGMGADGFADQLAVQFAMSPRAIQRAGVESGVQSPAAGAAPAEEPAAPARNALWSACCAQARPRLDGLAERLRPAASWEDLVLPPPTLAVLRDAVSHFRQRHTVYDTWGFRAKCARGLGISALFSGPSGTGKTMAAEVLANELRLDLFRIDLSQVVSKYIGETEKNLRRVFDAAEQGGGILLFDEADALFGKRSEVRDSHDRYANIEVSYLLQRMETYRGLAILTSNMKEALDPAFLRRLRFIVTFPFPDAAARAEIWRRVFPTATPLAHLDFAHLARMSITGGHIRNIAVAAAVFAAEACQPVAMNHVIQAARSEYAKLERPLTEIDPRGFA